MKESNALLVFPRQFMMGYMNLERDYSARRYPPLGLLYVSSVLKDMGFKIDLVDETISPLSEKRFNANNYNFIAFYADTTTKESVAAHVAKIRAVSATPILIGGPATFQPELFLQHKDVIVCHGEGEATIKELVTALENNQDWKDTPGISFSAGSKVITTDARALIEDLDTISFPDRDAINVNDYHDHYNLNSRGIFSTLITSRGCPMGCSYCSSSNFWGRRVRFRSVDNVIEELIYIKEKYNVRYVDFVDDMINLNQKWLTELCDKLIKAKLHINWSCNMFPNAMPFEVLKKMRFAGANTIKLGVQSASGTILDNIHRGAASVASARKLTQDAKHLGFIIFLDFIFGLPGENKETISESINFALSNNPQIAKFYKLDFLEGSELNEKKNSRITQLSNEEVKSYCKLAWKRFYLRPQKIFEFIWMYISRPAKIVRIFRHLKVLKSVVR